MLPLTKEELKLHQDAKACYICRKRFLKYLLIIKIIGKLENTSTIQVNKEMQHVVFVI